MFPVFEAGLVRWQVCAGRFVGSWRGYFLGEILEICWLRMSQIESLSVSFSTQEMLFKNLIKVVLKIEDSRTKPLETKRAMRGW